MENNYPQIKKIRSRKLRRLVADFVSEHEYYANKADAEDECMFASEQFVEMANKILGNPRNLGVLSVGNSKPYERYCRGAAGHYVVRIGCMRIDFTARQFHTSFPFPRVWEVSAREDSWVKGTGKSAVSGINYYASF